MLRPQTRRLPILCTLLSGLLGGVMIGCEDAHAQRSSAGTPDPSHTIQERRPVSSRTGYTPDDLSVHNREGALLEHFTATFRTSELLVEPELRQKGSRTVLRMIHRVVHDGLVTTPNALRFRDATLVDTYHETGREHVWVTCPPGLRFLGYEIFQLEPSYEHLGRDWYDPEPPLVLYFELEDAEQLPTAPVRVECINDVLQVLEIDGETFDVPGTIKSVVERVLTADDFDQEPDPSFAAFDAQRLKPFYTIPSFDLAASHMSSEIDGNAKFFWVNLLWDHQRIQPRFELVRRNQTHPIISLDLISESQSDTWRIDNGSSQASKGEANLQVSSPDPLWITSRDDRSPALVLLQINVPREGGAVESVVLKGYIGGNEGRILTNPEAYDPGYPILEGGAPLPFNGVPMPMLALNAPQLR